MVSGRLVSHGGESQYRIDAVEEMAPFLTTVVSHSDLWMFASSAGTLTAGRCDPDHALLPYETDDRLHRAVGVTGPITVIARTGRSGRDIWIPFDRTVAPGHTRSLTRSVLGHRLTLEEHHPTWRLTFRSTWTPSDTYGWVRTAEIVGDDDASDGDYEILDGLLGVVPGGVDALLGQIRSNLADAYKRSELAGDGRAGIYSLEALIIDRAEPAESLTSALVWSSGLDGAQALLDERAVSDMVAGRPTPPADLLTGRRGSYLLRGRATVGASGSARWWIVADTGLDHARTVDRLHLATSPDAVDIVLADVETGADRLAALVDAADARQTTGDPIADAHHLSNVLFNSMRGGVFPHGMRVEVADFADFLRERNRHVHERQASTLRELEPWTTIATLRAVADSAGDPDLTRLVSEYLPLTFSRRHGDPSRPWNRFSIGASDPDGGPVMAYEGNWRDIFQNWEALLLSYPDFTPNVVATFLNASTREGYNPYRISRAGIDWEVPDPDDPWSHIGYWGDHQIVYLLRLLELWDRYEPGAVDAWLDRRLFVFAEVPYTIASHDEIVRDPRDTITYDARRAVAIEARVDRVGGDGRLAVDADDSPIRVNLLEKLTVPALAKLSNLVPGGGIWMNTQRPEWNDANNALAGPGLSLVTLYHLRRYLDVLGSIARRSGADTVEMTSTTATWLADVVAILDSPDTIVAVDDDVARRIVVDRLGRAAEAHRERVVAGGDDPVAVPAADVDTLCTVARTQLDRTIEASRRDDGLYHSYNRVSFPSDTTAVVDRLGLMLEGQVAVLSSGLLTSEGVLGIVDDLFRSALHRPDQDSFLLYPNRALPSFLERNLVPAHRLSELGIGTPDGPPTAVFAEDHLGGVHFRPEIVNRAALEETLAETDLSDAERDAILAVHEEVFDHASFTGRSGTMYGYEGLGCIYWHMVAKLLVAIQEAYWAAYDREEADVVLAELVGAYRRVRDGLGFRKDPAVYGAIPVDCYSHTPADRGAQQPGMTGQVKEEILTRFGELGFRVVDGRCRLDPGLLPVAETFPARSDGASATFTVCAVPQEVVVGDAADTAGDAVTVVWADGTTDTRTGLELDRDTSRELFSRSGSIARITWTLGPSTIARWRALGGGASADG